MGRFSFKTMLFLFIYTALMTSSYRFLPKFSRLMDSYPSWVLSACWISATLGAFLPVTFKQIIFSDRFWYSLVTTSTVGTWSGFWLLYFWGENEARNSSQYPGLGAVIFIAFAAIFSCMLSFTIGWFIPKQRNP